MKYYILLSAAVSHIFVEFQQMKILRLNIAFRFKLDSNYYQVYQICKQTVTEGGLSLVPSPTTKNMNFKWKILFLKVFCGRLWAVAPTWCFIYLIIYESINNAGYSLVSIALLNNLIKFFADILICLKPTTVFHSNAAQM